MSAPLRPTAAIGLIARREIVTQLRSKALFIGLGFIVVLMAGYGLLFSFLISDSSSSSLALSGQARQLRPALAAAAERSGTRLTIFDVDRAAAEQQIRDGDGPDALVDGGPDGYRFVTLEDDDSSLQSLVTDTVREQAVTTALRAAGADPAQVERASTVTPTVLQAEDPLRVQRIVIAFVVAFLLYLSVFAFGNAVAQGVVEEKTSRVVELLLSAVKPVHLLAGKILGLGVVGLIYMLALGLLATVGGLVAGLVAVPSTVLSALASAVLWYLVGFFLYACVYAAAGAMVSRQEELGAVIAPLAIVLIVPFVLTTSIAPSDPRNPLITVLSFVPFFSQMLMPMRMALGVAAVWEVLVSLVLALATIAGMVWLAARIYRNSVLRTGSRVTLSEALRGSATARS